MLAANVLAVNVLAVNVLANMIREMHPIPTHMQLWSGQPKVLGIVYQFSLNDGLYLCVYTNFLFELLTRVSIGV